MVLGVDANPGAKNKQKNFLAIFSKNDKASDFVLLQK